MTPDAPRISEERLAELEQECTDEGSWDYQGLKCGAILPARELLLILRELQQLRRERQSLEWQDIATAPKDGTRLIVYNPLAGSYLTNYVDGQWPMDGWGKTAGRWYPSPTHWRPLPPSPAR